MTPSKPLFNVQNRIVALVPAAGIGARALGAGEVNLPKQYRLLAGQAMLRHSVSALLADPRIQEVRVAVAPGDSHANGVLAGLARTHCSPCGGATRAQTVLNALSEAQLAPEDWVLVHDAARPGLPRDALARLIDACLADGVGGLLAMPAADTLKKAQPFSNNVAQTVAREGFWLAQTPQMFRAGLLLEALTRAVGASEPPTDEAQAMEALGYAPILVRGSGKNTKITWPEDFQWVESWL
ncbi:2-C-methyl-D-erythritol 4-phosphate cytidylyltransferase [Zwartia sp.]|jgi:2-C-methyl-D-erythritol 4-phosphate cytidylyltransferase|uniref:2-C-methyl-D-erythritol 4-phosphate cytidylyltransferase n=1 Tax=Zwartia sp. TaxID=2978004 RepID=UPI003BB0DD8E